jgi:predicted dienelactone hydrolase
MPVGFRQGRFEDAARPNWDGDGPRPLSWAAWYPAPDDAVEHEHFLGPPAAPQFTIGPDAQDAPLAAAPRRCPVVLLSHGTGGAALGLGWFGRRLAQHGFIAVGVNHHGNTLTEPYRAEGFLCWWERARDLTVLLDQVQMHGDFADRLDADRIYVAGYSLGGCTAAALLGAITENSRFQRTATSRDYARGVNEFPDIADHLPGLLETSSVFRDSWARMSNSHRDPRIKAAFMMAPGRSVLGFNEPSLAAIDRPARILVGGADFTAPATIWMHERLRQSQLEMLAQQAGHYVFLPEATEAGRRNDPETCTDAPGIDRRAIHERAAAAAVELFEAN